MPVYQYISNMPAVKDTIEGNTFFAGVYQTFAEDQYTLNKYVPARLDRYVDGVLSNQDLIVTSPLYAQERFEALQSLGLTEDSLQALLNSLQQGTLGGVAPVQDSANVSLVLADEGKSRAANPGITYTISPTTAWPLGGGTMVYLPTTGGINFAVTGGATLNGATATLTRTIANNPTGIMALTKIQGTNAYSLTGY